MSDKPKTNPAVLDKNSTSETPIDVTPYAPPETEDPRLAELRKERRNARRWWIKTLVQPIVFFSCLALLFVGLGVAQRFGWFTGAEMTEVQAAAESGQRYICPMMCVPPSEAPGRCPVCGMELVPLTEGGGDADPHSVHIPTAARRIANIQTVSVKSMPVTRTVRAIGELNYDESARKTLSAYVAGRVEKLHADYTGVHVSQGDQLALLYSPKLYTSQVSYLLAVDAAAKSKNATLQSVIQSSTEMLKTSRQRLVEMGMTDRQIAELDQTQEANSRIEITAPISGTVVNKLVTEGQYLEEGQAIYELADLTSVWLMLRLFPEDAASVRYGQRVEAEVDSLPGEVFIGRVAFIDPNVDPKTRTVGVRVVIPNPVGRLRIGDYAKASINVPLSNSDQTAIYDPELADKWISPRHPHIIEDEPGECPLCGVELVPAAEFGFTDQPEDSSEALTVPRDAVLMAGNSSIVYVETEPGRFEIRPVVLGPLTGDQIVVRTGVKSGELVAAKGNFLVDSAMQLSGNPSLIDPTKLKPTSIPDFDPAALEQLAKLPAEDRVLAEKQVICPVTEEVLGSMGVPLKIDLDGQAVFICCAGCESSLRAEPDKHLAKLSQPNSATSEEQKKIRAALAELSPEDKAAAELQVMCPVADYPLGSMGVPKKVNVADQIVFICCEGCRDSLIDNPDKYLKKLAAQPKPSNEQGSAPLLPPVGKPQLIEPDVPPLPGRPAQELKDGHTNHDRTADAQRDKMRGTIQ